MFCVSYSPTLPIDNITPFPSAADDEDDGDEDEDEADAAQTACGSFSRTAAAPSTPSSSLVTPVVPGGVSGASSGVAAAAAATAPATLPAEDVTSKAATHSSMTHWPKAPLIDVPKEAKIHQGLAFPTRRFIDTIDRFRLILAGRGLSNEWVIGYTFPSYHLQHLNPNQTK